MNRGHYGSLKDVIAPVRTKDIYGYACMYYVCVHVCIFIYSRTISSKGIEHVEVCFSGWACRDFKFETPMSDFKGKKMKDCHHGNK